MKIKTFSFLLLFKNEVIKRNLDLYFTITYNNDHDNIQFLKVSLQDTILELL